MQLQGIVFIQLQGNDMLVSCQGNLKFIQRFIHKTYNHSRQLYSFTKLYSFQGAYQFIQGNIILVQGKHINSGKLYPLKEIYSLRNIYSLKFKAICSFKETTFIEHCCVCGNSRNIYSKNVPSHFMIIISFAITIS